ncbi:EamA family transporter [Iamia sp.]|uniref:EamA family transporter n=1 Tax=Iamia sp. TaxID=2722710 RepID=UPI002C080E14|nr:EamA family transporter [Iamia sp.]HXH58103.1 EamA family transporter [Iamia sp.]
MPRLVALSFIWGWSFLFIQVAGQDLTPSAVAGGRTGLGALVLLTFLRVRGLALPRDRRTVANFFVVGAAGSAIPFTLLAWGGQHIDSGLAAVLNASTPLFAAGLAVPVLGERLRAKVVGGLLVGLLGVAIVAGVGGSTLTESGGFAVLAPVGAGMGYGLTFCWSARHLMGIPPVVAAAGQVTAATILLAPIAITTSIAHGVVPGLRPIGSLLLLGAVGTGVAYVLSFRIVADLGATVASLVTYLIPVVALVVGALVLGEEVTPRIVVGGAVIIGSVALVTRARRQGARGPGPSGPATGDPTPGGGVVAAPDVAAAPPTVPSVPAAPGRHLPRWGARAIAVAAVAVAAVDGTACGDADEETGACGPVRREPLDTRTVHVLPGAEAPEYRTDPPTSGPHLASPSTRDVRSEAIAPAVQVGILEEGGVLLQHAGLSDADRERVEALAGDDVIVAPGDGLPEGAGVVATAWVTKQVCDAVDVGALRDFAEENRDNGPGEHD